MNWSHWRRKTSETLSGSGSQPDERINSLGMGEFLLIIINLVYASAMKLLRSLANSSRPEVWSGRMQKHRLRPSSVFRPNGMEVAE